MLRKILSPLALGPPLPDAGPEDRWALDRSAPSGSFACRWLCLREERADLEPPRDGRGGKLDGIRPPLRPPSCFARDFSYTVGKTEICICRQQGPSGPGSLSTRPGARWQRCAHSRGREPRREEYPPFRRRAGPYSLERGRRAKNHIIDSDFQRCSRRFDKIRGHVIDSAGRQTRVP
jgi:hypothetical protein